MSDTPMTDDDFSDLVEDCNSPAAKRIEQLERELAEAREQLRLEQRRVDSFQDVARQIFETREQRDMLAEVIKAATVLIAAKGRHNTMLAYQGLREALAAVKGEQP